MGQHYQEAALMSIIKLVLDFLYKVNILPLRMPKRWTLECMECGKKENFVDVQDISHSHWKIIAWNVKENEPVLVCNKCEYGQSKKK